MDRGGRVVEPLGAGFAGEAAARPAADQPLAGQRHPVSRLLAPFASLGRRRRHSVAVPLAQRIPRLTGTSLVFTLFAVIGGYGFVSSGAYDDFTARHGEPRNTLARALGFGLEKITISGISRFPEAEILRIAGISNRTSLPFLGAATIRDRLIAEPFIKSAEIRKLYPNELAITIVEREPYALWQRNGELFVVSADGTAIDHLRDQTLATLPLVVGELANVRAAAYVALLDAAGPLRSKVRAGMLVSGRRWTLKMENGLDVRLPEDGAVAAMARLVRLQRESGILDKDVLAIDLRLPDRVVVRLTEEAAATRAEQVKKKIQRGVKGIET